MKKILIQITAYCGCLIGSGFATGKEIQVYFLSENKFSLFTIAISILVFGILFFIDSFNNHYEHVLKVTSMQKGGWYAISKMCKLIYLLCMVSVFIAGISTLLSHYFKLSYIITVFIVMLVFMFFALKDIKVAVNLNLIITIVIISAMFLLSISYIKIRGVDLLKIGVNDFNFNQIYKGLIYVSYNIILPISFSNAVINHDYDQKNYLFKNFFYNILPACMILGVLLIVVAVCISLNENIFVQSEMPFVTIASFFGEKILKIYSVVLLGTMFVSSLTTFYSLIAEVEALVDNNTKKVGKIFFIILCCILSCVGFTNFIVKIYPLLAIIGVMIIFISIKRFISILLIVKRKKCII